MNKLVLALGFVTLQFLGYAQNGLEKIIVEKYYISTKEDSDASQGTLPVGSVTYRVYADMLPGYRFQALYGNSDHPLKIATSTSFFNNEDRGATTANGIASAQLKNNTVALDSWLSVGASAVGQFGVLKEEDNGVANLLTASSILNNLDPALGIGLKTQDGNMAGKPEAVTLVGFTDELDVFDAISQSGNSFSTKDGAISALSGATGPTAENRILLGQFTTDGVFTFELNIQIGTPIPGVSEKYVASNPINGEFSIPTLIRTGNNPPEVAITSPSNNAKIKAGVETTISVNATDSDGTIEQVEFYVDGTSLGIDNTAPYSFAYTPTEGTHQITATATDNLKATTTSTSITIVVSNNIAPVVTIKAPKKARIGAVTLEANATDEDGTIKHVAFYVDSALVGKDSIAPYAYDWSAVLGKHTVYAIATDDKGDKGNSNTDSIEIFSNILPEITILSPTNKDIKIIKGSNILIQASASDADGKVKQVEFFVDGNTVGIDSVTPYTANYTAVVGKHLITAVVTDNQLEKTTSSTVTIEVIANILPEIVLVTPSGTDTKLTTGDTLLVLANATDENGTVRAVEFFVDNKSIGIDSVTPYTANYLAAKGTHYITAVATDDQLAKTTSSTVMIEVMDNQLPIVSISNYFETIYKEDVLKITANAYDLDGTIKEVEFFIDSVSIGLDQMAPYSVEWIAKAGMHHIKAVAKDDKGAKANSSIKTIEVKNYTAGLEEERIADVAIDIYPNPASAFITFEIKGANNATFTAYQIVDNLGRIVLEKNIEKNQNTRIETIDIQHLEKGVYHFHSTMNGMQLVQKFIVE